MINAAILFLAGIVALAIVRQFRNRLSGNGRGGMAKQRKCRYCGERLVGNSECFCRRGA